MFILTKYSMKHTSATLISRISSMGEKQTQISTCMYANIPLHIYSYKLSMCIHGNSMSTSVEIKGAREKVVGIPQHKENIDS